jgi:hypothetical protein
MPVRVVILSPRAKKLTLDLGSGNILSASGAAAKFPERGDGNTANPTLPTATFNLVSASGTNLSTVKSTGGQLLGYQLYNNSSSAKFVKLYDKGSSPTVGSDTPKITIGVPANGSAPNNMPQSIPFLSGIYLAITNTIPDNSTVAVQLNEVSVSINYL